MKVKYIGEKETSAFESDKIYEVHSIEWGLWRIDTELDEDYLFSPKAFEVVEGSPDEFEDLHPRQ